MRSDDHELRLFAYGSLIFEPELEEAVINRIPARLDGYMRGFNKRSRSRGCPIAESFDAFPAHHPEFVVGDRNDSLVLGTQPRAGEAIIGLLLVYDGAAREAVLSRTDRREDYAPDRPLADNGYLREPVEITCLRTGRASTALTYLTNTTPGAAWAAPPGLDRADRARLLINATPRRPLTPGTREARGLHYLEGVRDGLRGLDIVDGSLEALAGAIRALDGPWVGRVRPAAGS